MNELKYSKYLAITDYVDKVHRIVYSFLTGKALLISEEIFNKIVAHDTKISEKTRDKFVEAQILVDFEQDEMEKVVSENIKTINERNVFSFTIFPSSNCQLGCHYCGQVHSPGKIDKNLYSDIFKHVTQGVSAIEKNHLAIGWFGGEPLLGIGIIEELTPELKRIAERNGCNYSARITTNGLLLHRQNFQKLIDNDVRDITITLDGTKKSHDQRRPTKGGGPSFDVIIKNLTDAFAHIDIENEQLDIMVRINVDKFNQDDVIPLLELLGQLNFQNKITSFDIAPVHAWGNDAHLRSSTIQEFADFKIDCYLKLIELGFIDTVPLPGRVKVICQAVTHDSVYMQTDGSVFDCSEHPLIPEEQKAKTLGHISRTSSIKESDRHYTSWNEGLLNNEFPCTNCRILPICGGGCPKSWKDGHIPCPDYKYNIEDLIALAYLSSSNKNNLFEQRSLVQ